MDFKDDIVAISTPTGMGAIALIRITSDNALMKVEPFFKSRSGTSISDIKSHSIIYGDFTYNDEIVDEVVLSYFAKGKSFTGQETVEISCHGSTIFKRQLLKSCLQIIFDLQKLESLQ